MNFSKNLIQTIIFPQTEKQTNHHDYSISSVSRTFPHQYFGDQTVGKSTFTNQTVKRTPKNDLGYGVKKQTLDEIGMTSSEFDLLDGMFGGNPVDEFDEILEDLEL